jgi:hypothetical protein
MSEVEIPNIGFRLIHRQTPGSSAIERIGYNPLTQEMYILFNKGGRYPEYIFGGVPSDQVEDFMNSGSPGSYYNQNFRQNRKFTVKRAFGSYRLGAIRRRVANVFRF